MHGNPEGRSCSLLSLVFRTQFVASPPTDLIVLANIFQDCSPSQP